MRRDRAGLLIGSVLSMLAGLTTTARAADDGPVRVYIGTYTGEKSEGIYLLHLDPATGKLEHAGLAAKTTNPSFLALHPNGRFLYAVGEVSDFDGRKTGGVAAFAIDAESGELSLLNQQSSQGAGPCHLAVDRAGKAVLVANYGGGSVASLPIGEDGQLAPAASAIQHEGNGANPQRQEKPHAHSINVDAKNRFAVAADLGIDKLLVYRFDPATARLTPHDPPSASVAPGAGPRHFAFHPTGRFAFVINELNSTVTSFAYDAEAGVLTEVQTLSTLPKDFDGNNSTAEVQVHPSGRFLYGSNRGHDSIAAFTIDESTGRLTAAGHQKTGGRTPRNFGIDPSGTFLLAANQASDSIHVFRIDPQSGSLEPTGHSIDVPSPVCVKFHIPSR